ncbi:MAG: adenylate/guanylate cyclase domain-containing protein [Spirochaetes bacterium]|nr:adenylate/guanylate cyclase domain-containing protein [Spirochaetota bacterium]MBU1080325.1 adenylate/guanylate cyclase domain-containing protein [Spirochaetota bacterium]
MTERGEDRSGSPKALPLLSRVSRELLLSSGQFALFYIIMNASQSGLGFFSNAGHVALLGFLLIQTAVLALFGARPSVRFLGSLIAPLAYTALESREGWDFIVNAAHVWFWAFSAVTGAFQAAMLSTKLRGLRIGLEFALTIVNVGSFLILYFYFDTVRTLEGLAAQAPGAPLDIRAQLTIGAIASWLPEFLSDPTHVYILIGGALLGLSLGLGRADVLRLKERIDALFGKYVDEDVRDRIVSGGRAVSQETELCVLFSDIRDFTGLSEHHDAQAVTEMLNRYFTLWAAAVRRHGGIVDKFIGDAVMAVFGLRAGTEPCDEAVACLLEMREALPGLRRDLAERALPALSDFGVGIHFGKVVVGDIGSEERKNFTVIGDTVNVASRLESACKSLGTPCVVSARAFARLSPGNAARFKALGGARLKGKAETVQVYGLS